MDRAIRANVVISSLDARGLYVLIPGGDASQPAGNSSTSALKTQMAIDSASANADVMAELADATGGSFFHNNNDLLEGFKRIAAQPEFIYVLGFSPQNLKLDGSYHALQVTLTKEAAKSNAGLQLQALALSRQIRRQADMALGLDASLLEDRVPLISEGVQVIPSGSNKFRKMEPALFYAEIYEPLLLNPDPKSKPAIGIQIRILDRKTKDQKFSTGMMRLDMPEKSDNPMIPVAERVPPDSLVAGQYVVEFQAVDTAGKQVTRTADFDLE